jgi:hypothetical protein
MTRGPLSILTPELRWAVAAVIGSLALLVFFRGGALRSGQDFDVALTVVPNDAVDLDCDASPGPAGRCAFKDGKRDRSVEHPLRPFVSVGGELMVLSGVFESPKVAAWLASARGARSQERVTLDCHVRYLATLERVGVHFRNGSPFDVHNEVRGGVAENCSVRASQ